MMTNLNISELDSQLITNCKRWLVLYSKSRREKKIAQYCGMKNVKYYLPLVERIKVYGRKKVRTNLPLFPGYLFCFADDKERYQLLMTHQIARILNVSNQKGFLNDIEKIFKVENNGIKLTSCDLIKERKKARIDIGPLKGMEGIITEIRGKNRLFLKVDIINQVASVEINGEHVKILN